MVPKYHAASRKLKRNLLRPFNKTLRTIQLFLEKMIIMRLGSSGTLLSLRTKNVKMLKSKVKITLTCFFDIKEIKHWKFVPPKRNNQPSIPSPETLTAPTFTINDQIFGQPEKRILHHDNVPFQKALSEKIFLGGGKKKWCIIYQLTSFNLLWAFQVPDLNISFKGSYFKSLGNNQSYGTAVLKGLLGGGGELPAMCTGTAETVECMYKVRS